MTGAILSFIGFAILDVVVSASLQIHDGSIFSSPDTTAI
jgi:hypothetical protein